MMFERIVVLVWGIVALYVIGCTVYYPFFTNKLPGDVNLFLPVFFTWVGVTMLGIVIYLIYACTRG